MGCRLLVFAAFLAASVTISNAADDLVAPADNAFWSGTYIGVNAGISSTDFGIDYAHIGSSTIPGGFLELPGQPCFGGTGCTLSFNSKNLAEIFGGQIGHNFILDQGLFGLEADLRTGFGEDNSVNLASTHPFGVDTLAIDSTIDWVSTVRGRIGILQDSSLALYLTGGVAFGHVNTTVARICDGGCPVPTNNISDDEILVGWSVGVGAEKAINQEWSLRVQYLYTDLGSSSVTSAADAAFAQTVINTNYRNHEISLGINFHF